MADERALGDDVGDADPDVNLRGGDVQCALVLGPRSGARPGARRALHTPTQRHRSWAG